MMLLLRAQISRLWCCGMRGREGLGLGIVRLGSVGLGVGTGGCETWARVCVHVFAEKAYTSSLSHRRSSQVGVGS